MGALDKFLNYMKLNDEEGEDGYYDDDYFDEEDEPLDNTPKKKTTSVKEKDISEQTDDKAVKRTLPKVTPMRQSKKIGENGGDKIENGVFYLPKLLQIPVRL